MRGQTGMRSWMFGYLIATILFLGFGVGFTVGYFMSKAQNSTTGASTSTSTNIPLPLVDPIVAEKAMTFMEDFLSYDFSGSSDDKQEEAAPLMGFALRSLFYLNRQDAYSLLMDASSSLATISQYSFDFFLISSGLDAQKNQAYCGVAAAVGVINSLRYLRDPDGSDSVVLPVDRVYKPYHYATQTDVFNNCTSKYVIKNVGGGPGVDGILTPPYGLNMEQVAALLKCNLSESTWKVTTKYVDSTHMTVGKMRFDLKNTLTDANSRVLVNYDRKAVGQKGGGHWSPIGSYSEKDDVFLVLDVAKYKYPPVWIPTELLFNGMATTDTCGTWDSPNGQDALSQEDRFSTKQGEVLLSQAKVGCESKLRGYITVTRI